MKELKPSPEAIIDKFSSVLENGFHAIFRIKGPIRHLAKKVLLMCIREAFYVWYKEWNDVVYNKVKESVFPDYAIEMRRFYSLIF